MSAEKDTSAAAETSIKKGESEQKIPVTDTHKKIIFSFMKMIRNLETKDHDGIDAITQILASEFNVDPAGLGGQHDADIDLVELVDQAESKQSPETAEKFKGFLELLKKKGYFNGIEEGSEEYEARMKKARAKFQERNNPYEGLGAEELKSRGNALLTQGKYKEAIGFYTRAIELAPENHIYYANRAAAHTHLKDYRSAIFDCERSIGINSKYAKSFQRLGTASFYVGEYQRAVDAYTKAVELDPSNEGFQEDLRSAKEKLAAQPATQAPAMGGMPGGMPGFPGMPGMAPGQMPDYNQMMSMMNNPQFMSMAQNMMQNPEFSSMISNMAGQMGMQSPDPEAMQRMMAGQRSVDAEGNLKTPFGKLNKDAFEKLRNDEVNSNPKFRAIMEDVQQNGMSAFQKYMGDPDVMTLMNKFMGIMQKPEGGDAAVAAHKDPNDGA